MNNRQIRMLGLSSVIMGLLIPLLIILTIVAVPFVITFKASQIVIAKRSFLDKRIPFVTDYRLVEYDQIGCGDNQAPDDLKRYFTEESNLKAQTNKLLDLANPKSNNICQFSSLPNYFLVDLLTKQATPIQPDTIKFRIDKTNIDSIRSKVSFLQSSYNIKTNKVNLSITPDSISATYSNMINLNLKRTVLTNQDPAQDPNQDKYLDLNNPSNFEVLGFVD
jgi:hypothetical protein